MNYERANQPRFPFTIVFRRVRGCLTLMLAAAANATATPAPARHLCLTNVNLGVPFATPRTRSTIQVIGSWPRDPTIQAVG